MSKDFVNTPFNLNVKMIAQIKELVYREFVTVIMVQQVKIARDYTVLMIVINKVNAQMDYVNVMKAMRMEIAVLKFV